MAKRRRPSRAMRNQAKWDRHAQEQTQHDVSPGLAGYAGGKMPQLVTGSIQAAPRNVRVAGGNKKLGIESPDPMSRRGIKLQPFADYVPPVPSDYATTRPSHLYIKPVYDDKGKRIDVAPRPHRELLDSERGEVRPAHEAAMMMADRPSGAEQFITYGERHADDVKAGLYRDGLGRVMRTTDMADDLTTADYIKLHGVPTVRTRRNQREEISEAREAERVAKAEAREAKKAARAAAQAARAQSRADRMTSRPSRAEANAAARAHLAKMGVPEGKMTSDLIKAARDVLEHQAQIAEYTGEVYA